MSNPVTINGWPLGVNTLAPDFALPDGSLRNGVNVDVLDDGKLRRRTGYVEVLSGLNAYGATSHNGAIHYVSDGSLMSLAGGASVVLRSGLALKPMAFLEVNGSLYFSNNFDTGVIQSGVAKPWGVEQAGPPALTTLPGGLPQGTYQALCTFEYADGEEGGCGTAASITIDANELGLMITPPLPVSEHVTAVNIYLTGQNDSIFRLAGSVSVGASLSLLTLIPRGRELRTRYLQPMPPGSSLAEYKGRIYAASGHVVWYSEPLLYGQCDLAQNFLIFPGGDTLIVAQSDGLYVSSGGITYFLSGTGPADFVQRQVMPSAIAAGSLFPLPDVAHGWLALTGRGLSVLGPGGEITVFDETVSFGAALSGATLVKERDGLKQYIGVQGATANVGSAAALDYMEAEIIRKDS